MRTEIVELKDGDGAEITYLDEKMISYSFVRIEYSDIDVECENCGAEFIATLRGIKYDYYSNQNYEYDTQIECCECGKEIDVEVER